MWKSEKNVFAEFSDELVLSEVLHLAHLGFFLLQWPTGSIEFSEEAKRILNLTKKDTFYTTENFITAIEKDDVKHFRQTLENSVNNVSQFDIEFQIRTTDGHVKSLQSLGHPVSEYRGKSKIFGTLMDVTDRKETERALIEEKEKTQMILDTCASFILVVGADRKVKLINRTGCRILGLPEREIVGKNWFSNFIPRNQRKRVKNTFLELMTGHAKWARYFENEIITSGGKGKKWIEWHITIIRDEDELPVGLLSSGIDITQRKEAEKTRMKAVIEGEERERQRVARELHDGLMQMLSAISLNLKAIESEANQFPELKKKAYQNALQLVGSALSDTRRISHQMMPRDLEHFGLIDALINLCEKVNQSSQVQIGFTYKGDRRKLEKKLEVILFRISQELINNILKHSNASKAGVEFNQKKNKFLIHVSDNGDGFNTSENFGDSEGIGLQNISTRVRSLNGTFAIKSEKGNGTFVKIMIPLE